MSTQSAVELALIAWSRDRAAEGAKEQLREDAANLGATGAFSNRNIAHITGLDVETVGKITGKRSKTGGRFNPEALPWLWELRVDYQDGFLHLPKAQLVVDMGVSPGMVARLIGMPATTLYAALRKVKP